MPGPDKSAHIGLGGNLGDPAAAMTAALHMLENNERISVLAVSSLYRTPPWGKTDQPDFLNACAVLGTSLGARALLDECLGLERKLKRVRGERWGPRLIDIDILEHSDGPVHEPGLIVPHPRLGERAFVLVPLAEIAGDLEIAGKTVKQLANDTDRRGLEVIAGPGWWESPAAGR